MHLSKRDVRIVVASCVGAHVLTGLVWVWSRQGFSWPIAWTHRLRDDLHLCFTWALTIGSGLATTLAAVGAVTLWFRGTRRASFLMVAYGLAAGALLVRCLSI